MSFAKLYAKRFGTGKSAVKIFDEYIIVARRLHFYKRQLLPLRTHMTYVNELCIKFIITA